MDDISGELKDLSPLLHDLRGKIEEPAVPAGYFDGLPDAILLRVEEQEAEQKIFPVLSGLKKDISAVPAPERYFEELPQVIMAKVAPQKRSRVIRIFAVVAVAAAVLFAAISIGGFFEPQVKNAPVAEKAGPAPTEQATVVPEKIIVAEASPKLLPAKATAPSPAPAADEYLAYLIDDPSELDDIYIVEELDISASIVPEDIDIHEYLDQDVEGLEENFFITNSL